MGRIHFRIEDRLPLSSAILEAKVSGRVPIIADIKPISPRDGDLLNKREPSQLARDLEKAGACALSVVTEIKHFGGSKKILEEVVKATTLPVLRKDFFSETEQITESFEAGASAVLLIMATTPDPLAYKIYQGARKLRMEVVVEIHSREELRRALRLNPTIIGINNRDILRLETDSGDIGVTEKLASLIPKTILTISESALLSHNDIRRAIGAGADAVMIGTAILKATDLRSCIVDLTHCLLEN